MDRPSVDARLIDMGDAAPRFARHWAVAGARDVALLLHGVESHSEWFKVVAAALQGRGVAAFGYDRRGFGRSPGARGHANGAAAVLDEVDRAVTHLGTMYGRVHLVGLSWGGLLAAAYRERHDARVASVTLLVPGLFPRKRPATGEIVRAALGLKAAVTLPLTPADFARDPAALAFIEQDAWRVTEVSLGFLRTTAQLFKSGRALSASPIPMEVLLAEVDPVIDSLRTAALAADRGVAVHHVADTVHSLVLETPGVVADRVMAMVGAAGQTGFDTRANAHAS